MALTAPTSHDDLPIAPDGAGRVIPQVNGMNTDGWPTLTCHLGEKGVSIYPETIFETVQT